MYFAAEKKRISGYLTIRSFLITHRRYGAEINGFSPDFSLKALFNVV
jgi:hypothetical protein